EGGTREAARTPPEQGAKHQRLPRAGETTDVMRPEMPAHTATDKGKKDKGKKGREEPARTEPAAEPPKETVKRDEGTPPFEAKP
ncbi:hypothetical protein ABTA60_19965, partial [Acinetobacter baumannii]